MSNLVRRYKIHLVEPNLSNEEIELVDYLKNLIDNLKIFNDERYGNINFYISDKIIFEYEKNTKILWTIKLFDKVDENNHIVKNMLDIIKFFAEIKLKIKIEKIYISKYNDYIGRVLTNYKAVEVNE